MQKCQGPGHSHVCAAAPLLLARPAPLPDRLLSHRGETCSPWQLVSALPLRHSDLLHADSSDVRRPRPQSVCAASTGTLYVRLKRQSKRAWTFAYGSAPRELCVILQVKVDRTRLGSQTACHKPVLKHTTCWCLAVTRLRMPVPSVPVAACPSANATLGTQDVSAWLVGSDLVSLAQGSFTNPADRCELIL